MRKILNIAAVALLMSMTTACAPKATYKGVPANGDTVEVDPTDMTGNEEDPNANEPQNNTDGTNTESVEDNSLHL